MVSYRIRLLVILIVLFTHLNSCPPAKQNELYRNVIAHYICEPMKQAAAAYLIENMQYHQSFEIVPYCDYCNAIDSLFLLNLDEPSLREEADKILRKYVGKIRLKNDEELLTEDYLISQIDAAFVRWKTGEYLQHLNFDEFCEYVLPYKCLEGQMLDDWKDYSVIDWSSDTLWNEISLFENSVRHGYMRLHDYIVRNTNVKSYSHLDIIPVLVPRAILNAPYADCYEKAALELMYCRANGIPASIDYTPNWMNRNGVHYWINILNSTRTPEAFEPLDPNDAYPGYFRKNDYRMPKVYRFSWKPREILKEACDAGIELPPSLEYIFTTDVTAEYCRVAEFELHTDSKHEYLYLAVFDDYDWIPVDIAVNRKGTLKFADVAVGGTYCLVEYAHDRVKQVSCPFELSLNGEVHYYSMDSTDKSSLIITRKYPRSADVYGIRSFLSGGTLYGLDGSNDKTPDKIFDFPSALTGSIVVKEIGSYRYYSLSVNAKEPSDFAELCFYDHSGKRLYPKVLWEESQTSYYINHARLIDDDPLTFSRIEADDVSVSVIFDFVYPVTLGKVIYYRRGDGNDVFPGDRYELYYNTGRSWELHETMTAVDSYVEFHDVPRYALLYIKCLNRGRQHRIFTHCNEINWK